MKAKSFKISLVIFLIPLVAIAQQYATWKAPLLTLDNGTIKRIISFANNTVTTVQLKLSGSDFNFTGSKTREFAFLIDNKFYDGFSGWKFVSFTEAEDDHHGDGAVIRLKRIGSRA
jgi:hypothetical protein